MESLTPLIPYVTSVLVLVLVLCLHICLVPRKMLSFIIFLGYACG